LSERTSLPASPYGDANAGRNRRAGRDPRLDLFRGLSLIFIFIDHIPNNVLSYVTLHSVAFSDAAEVFVFISGYTAAMFYGRALQRQGWLVATAQIYRRVWQLYVAHIVIFVIFAAEVSYATVNIHSHAYSGDLGLDTFLDEPHVAVVKTVLLQYQPQFLDILPLYVVLLGAFPLVLFLLELHLLLPLVLSGAIYLLTLRFGWHPHSYPGGEGWYFNPLAWQCLFVIGATAGYFANSRQVSLPRDPWLWKLAIVVTAVIGVINISWVIHGAHSAFPGLLLQELSPFVVDKTNLAPLRLLSFFAIAVTTVHFVRDDSEFLHWRAARLIIQCGRHSLQVFCLGILLSVLGRILLTSFHDGILMQLAIDLAGIALIVAIAWLLTWYSIGRISFIDVGAPSENRTADVVNADNSSRETPEKIRQNRDSAVGMPFAEPVPALGRSGR